MAAFTVAGTTSTRAAATRLLLCWGRQFLTVTPDQGGFPPAACSVVSCAQDCVLGASVVFWGFRILLHMEYFFFLNHIEEGQRRAVTDRPVRKDVNHSVSSLAATNQRGRDFVADIFCTLGRTHTQSARPEMKQCCSYATTAPAPGYSRAPAPPRLFSRDRVVSQLQEE
jgi:hypothetical protein